MLIYWIETKTRWCFNGFDVMLNTIMYHNALYSVLILMMWINVVKPNSSFWCITTMHFSAQDDTSKCIGMTTMTHKKTLQRVLTLQC